jgi:Protein of unknown function (DUF4231)
VTTPVTQPPGNDLGATFERLIDRTNLDERQRDFLKLRWLDQLTWMNSKASNAQRMYYRLRLVTIVGAVVVPALVALNSLDDWVGTSAQVATWVVSLVVAVSAAIEGFFQFGQRWRNYRATAERLKTEGWLFLQLAGPYASANGSHAGAYPAFAGRVEELIQKDVDVYITEVAAEKKGSG